VRNAQLQTASIVVNVLIIEKKAIVLCLRRGCFWFDGAAVYMGRLQYSADGTYVCSSANSLGKKRHGFPLCLFQSLYGFGGA
jgi:hypothetical protein